MMKDMRLSVWVFATDLLPKRRSFYDKYVKKNIFTDHNPKEVFTKLKNSGVDGIELLIPTKFIENDYQYIKNLLKENKVTVNSIHQPLRFLSKTGFTEVQKLFIYARKFHAKVIVLHINSAGRQIYNKQYIKSLHKLEETYSIKIGFENQQKHFIYFHKKHLWEENKFPSVLNEIKFGITLDITHLATAKGDIIHFIEKNKDNVVNIHLSDYKNHYFSSSFRPAAFTHMPIGHGELPIKQFLKTLKNNNYQGLLTMEINTDLTTLCQSAHIIRRIIN